MKQISNGATDKDRRSENFRKISKNLRDIWRARIVYWTMALRIPKLRIALIVKKVF